MYRGEIVTLRFRDNPRLLATDLGSLYLNITEEGLLVARKQTQEKLGYLSEVIGIDLDEMLTLFGFEKIDS